MPPRLPPAPPPAVLFAIVGAIAPAQLGRAPAPVLLAPLDTSSSPAPPIVAMPVAATSISGLLPDTVTAIGMLIAAATTRHTSGAVEYVIGDAHEVDVSVSNVPAGNMTICGGMLDKHTGMIVPTIMPVQLGGPSTPASIIASASLPASLPPVPSLPRPGENEQPTTVATAKNRQRTSLL